METPEKVSVNKDELEFLINEVETKTAELHLMYQSCAKMLAVIGLSDGVTISPDAFSDSNKPFTKVIKSGASLLALMTSASMPDFIGKDAKKEITEKFSFFQEMLPILEKYNQIFEGIHRIKIEQKQQLLLEQKK